MKSSINVASETRKFYVQASLLRYSYYDYHKKNSVHPWPLEALVHLAYTSRTAWYLLLL